MCTNDHLPAPRQIALGNTAVAYELMCIRFVEYLQQGRNSYGLYGEVRRHKRLIQTCTLARTHVRKDVFLHELILAEIHA
jgi:hypothetical protein